MDWPEITKYKGIVSAQPRGEISNDLYTSNLNAKGEMVPGGIIREQLISFNRVTCLKPHRIIVYRDGISEEELNVVLLKEFDVINKACQSLEEDYLPSITFVVVQRRHHTLFSLKSWKQSNR